VTVVNWNDASVVSLGPVTALRTAPARTVTTIDPLELAGGVNTIV
jgi:hypothetical protein